MAQQLSEETCLHLAVAALQDPETGTSYQWKRSTAYVPLQVLVSRARRTGATRLASQVCSLECCWLNALPRRESAGLFVSVRSRARSHTHHHPAAYQCKLNLPSWGTQVCKPLTPMSACLLANRSVCRVTFQSSLCATSRTRLCWTEFSWKRTL